MVDTDAQSPPTDDTRAVLFPLLSFIVIPVIGAVTGFVGYLVGALLLEKAFLSNRTGSMLSYGQEAMLISLPQCTVLGAGLGIAAAFLRVKHRLAGTTILCLVASLGTLNTASRWSAQIAVYGRDPSEIVLYYPPLAICSLALMAVAWIVLRRHRS